MKKLTTLILIFWSVGLMAQNYFGVSGTVTDSDNGTPVHDQQMLIAFFSINDSTLIMDDIVETDDDGFYEFEGSFDVNMAIVQVGTIDCNGTPVYQFSMVAVNNPWATLDFTICTGGGGGGDCHAEFEYSQTGDLTIEFENYSQGEDLMFLWSFGDGESSEEENPVHVYPAAGEYTVTLYVAASDSSCFDLYEETVFVEGGAGDCEADFEYEIQDQHTVAFFNLSTGDSLTYLWSFGDGESSDEENPVHTYAMGGDYMVTLLISSADSSCFDVYEEDVHVGGGGGDECHAHFTYEETGNQTVEFFNLSEGDDLTYFWTFGDGETSDEENPVHTYAMNGEYLVTLFIASPDSSCFDAHDEMVHVGGGMGDCEAEFDYEQEDAYTFSFINKSEGENLLYFWAFGDGSYSEEENPVHTYSTDGYYWVTLMIANGDSTCFDMTEEMVIAGDSLPDDCQAYFEYDLTDDGYRVEFENESEGENLSYYWTFGDGSYSQEENPEHTYNEPGIYEVCLMIVSEDSACYDMYCEPVIIDDMGACVAQFAYYPDSLYEYTYQFVDLSYGNIESWSWDFGDGTYSDDQNPTHTFTEEGVYYVCLTIECEDDCGDKGADCTSTWCEEVYVGGFEDCFNFFTYQTVGNEVLFEGFHSGWGDAMYSWEFGDGTTGNGQVIEHTYDETGTFFVTLTSIGEDSCVATSSQVIVVGDSIEYNQIYGQVFEGDFPLEDGMVMIFSLEAGPNYEPFFDVTMIDSSGVYVFPYVPNGEFYVYAIPLDWNGYMPTYYGDVINWDDATTIVLGEPENPYDIHLVECGYSATPGNGIIRGTVYNSGVRSDYIDKIQMLLFDENHNAIGFTNVDEEGSFDLSNLGNGTYYVYAELSGVNSEYIQVQITEEQQEVVVNMTMEGTAILGTRELVTITEASDIYPNPASDMARIDLTNEKETVVNVQVTDITGRSQMVNEYKLPAGRTVINIPLSQLQTGIYFVRISNSEGDVITRKVVRQR